MRIASTRFRAAALLLLLTKGAAATDDNTEFAFNLFSDIAPILALFGEQFARQFISESFTWLDHFIFACVPLGILTALSGAIRVQGPKIAQSFIGRARENRATAEIELMSSTSQEVCEMFNGKGIIRTMGRPTIAQIIIFPDRYTYLENHPEDPDQSCGIYTLQTAVNIDAKGSGIMICEGALGQNFLEQMKKKFLVEKYLAAAVGSDLEKGSELSSNGKQYSSFDFLGPPNLQLNVSSGRSSREERTAELFVAAIAALILQLALLVIAAITVYHKPTKAAIGYEPQPYGLPCYITGSVLLFLGMSICSYAIESSTVEFMWKRRSRGSGTLEPNPAKVRSKRHEQSHRKKSNNETDDSEYPRLIWLQQSQRVNDQSFSSYVILGGSKRYVVTSSRQEDVQVCETLHKGNKLMGSDQSSPVRSDTTPVDSMARSEMYKLETSLDDDRKLLGAISLMALIRALIRRRLGKIPLFCHALSSHELDFLAARIVYNDDFREFDDAREQNDHLRDVDPKNICIWKVVTPRPNVQDRFTLPDIGKIGHTNNANADKLSTAEEIELAERIATTEGEKVISKIEAVPTTTTVTDTHDKMASSKRTTISSSNSRRWKSMWPRRVSKKAIKADEATGFHEGSSQQLVRVRERLGNLCKWSNSASAAALTLAQSIERFMAMFFPDQREPIEWVIETTKLFDNQSSHQTDNIVISLSQDTKSKAKRWLVEVGKIEAVLSLWIASIEAEMHKNSDRATSKAATPGNAQRKDELADWRRSKAGIGSKLDYCRIIGDNYDDGVLKRDISWWVGEQFAEQAEIKGEGSEPLPTRGGEKVKLVIGFNGPSQERPSRTDKARNELCVISSAYLPIILAQHLFTSFMWTIAEKLPRDVLRQRERNITNAVKIDSGTFNLYAFRDTWYRSKLSDFRLDTFVKYVESAGLGSASEILLCMVPALSYQDLLPNERILSLMPRDFQQIQNHGWAQTASFYHDLLKSSIGAEIYEYFALAVVVEAMEFVYLASEPFTKDIKPEKELDDELRRVVRRLAQGFPAILGKISPVYDLQKRRDDFEVIFHHYASHEEEGFTEVEFPLWQPGKKNSEQDELLQRIGVTKAHIQAFEAQDGGENSKASQAHEMENAPVLKVEDVIKADIFGWTVLHYAATGSSSRRLEAVLNSAEGEQPIHRWQDKFKRSPIHLAALCGKDEFLRKMLKVLKENKGGAVVSAVNAKGLDGMTPIHLAVKGQHVKCIDALLEHYEPTEVDIWGRAPVHLAAVSSNLEIAKKLLNKDSRPDQADIFRRTPLTYLMLLRDQNNDSRTGTLQKNMAEEFMKAWKNFDDKDDNGMTVLHYAVEFLDDEKIERYYLKRGAAADITDKHGRTPLHLAVSAEREKVVSVLLKYGAKASTKNDTGMTPLMLACEAGAMKVVKLFMIKDNSSIDKFADAVVKQDNKDKTALHYAIESEKFSEPDLKIIVDAFASKMEEIDLQTREGRTVLHTAIIAGKITVALQLLEHHAKPGIPDKDGKISLHHVSQASTISDAEAEDLIDRLITTWEKEEEMANTHMGREIKASSAQAFQEGTSAPYLSFIKMIDVRDGSLRTPLHAAILVDNATVVHTLLRHGANLKLKDSAGRSSLHHVAESNQSGGIPVKDPLLSPLSSTL
ncbi:hypothetical protein N0V90_002023 [Kalmusia sp. IMI 367209]|nr:hypothetical protein N0V90_002023 [Kalmusia sp. IMI 367209]